MPSLNEESPAQGVATSLLGRLALIGVALAWLCLGVQAHASSAPFPNEAEKARIDRLIVFYAKRYNVPVALARKVVKSESEYRALARNGPYWGLMQIRYDTAKGLGYRGPAKGLLDAETNLVYGIAYLSNALKAANGNMSRGHMLYRTGYYYEAKRRRVLDDMIVVKGFKPVDGSPTLLALAENADTGELWSGDPTEAVFAKVEARMPGLAPMPRPKPGEAQPAVVAAPAVVQASVTGAALRKGQAPLAAAVAAPAEVAQQQQVVAQAQVAATAPVVAKPQVVYASVLPLSRSPAFVAPAADATALLTAATVVPEMSPVADPTAPIPRPRPGPVVADSQAEAPEAAAAPVVVAQHMPLPRSRPAPSAQ